jgi:hypothetical protein
MICEEASAEQFHQFQNFSHLLKTTCEKQTAAKTSQRKNTSCKTLLKGNCTNTHRSIKQLTPKTASVKRIPSSPG